MALVDETDVGFDAGAVHDVVAAAFGRLDEARLVDALREDPAFLPWGSIAAVDEGGGRVVGHVMGTRIDVDGAFAVAVLGRGAPKGAVRYPAPFGLA